MPSKVIITGTYLHWPASCACCGGPSEAVRTVSLAKTRGKRVVRVTSSRSWSVPYCRACAGHSALGDLATTVGVAGLGIGGVVALLGMMGPSASWLAFGLAVVAIGSGGWVALRLQAVRSITPDCRAIAAAVRFVGYHRHDNEFLFRNDDYARQFVRTNSGKRHRVTGA